MLTFRPARAADLPRLREMEQGVLQAERPFNPTIRHDPTWYYDLEALITDQDSQLLVAEREGRVEASGYASIRTSKHALKHDIHAYLGFIYVSPTLRGQGVAGQVVERLLQWGQTRGARDFYLDVYAANEAAIRAYRKLGFVDNTIEMRLNLPGGDD